MSSDKYSIEIKIAGSLSDSFKSALQGAQAALDGLAEAAGASGSAVKAAAKDIGAGGSAVKAAARDIKAGNAAMEGISRDADEGADSVSDLGDSADCAKKKFSRFNSVLKGVKSGISGFAKAAGKIGKATMKATAAGIGTATTAAVGLGTAAVNVGSDFESAMSSVAATAGVSGKQYDKLEAAAREMGRTTTKTASEAANALEYMALAGWDVDTSIAGLPSVLKLSEASGMDLARSSDLVTDSMASLGISVKDLPNYLDVAAKAQNKSNQSAEQLMDAYLNVGGTMKDLNVPIEESAAALGVMANRGRKGGEAGQALGAIMANLTTGTGQAGKMMEKLGISAFSGGKFIGLKNTLEVVNGAMKGLTDEERNAALAALGGKEHVKDLNKLLDGLNTTNKKGVTEWDALTNELENCDGALETMAKRKMDNLKGDLAGLSSAASDLGISFYKDAGGPLRDLTKTGTGMINQLNSAYKSGGLSAMLAEVGNSMAQIVSGAAKYAPMAVNVGIDLIQNLLNGITQNSGGIASAAGNVLTTFANGIFTLAPQIAFAGIDIIVQLADSLTAQAPQLLSSGTQSIANFVSGLVQRGPDVAGAALGLTQALVTGIVSNAPTLLIAAVQLVGSLVSGIGQMLPQVVQMGVQLILGLAQGLVSSLPSILQTGTQAIVNLVNGLTQALPMLVQGGFQLITMLVQGIAQNLPAIAQAAVTIIMSLVSGLASAIPQLWEAAKSLPGAIWDAFCSVDWLSVGAELITSIGTGIIDGLKSIGGSVVNTIKGWFGGGDDSGAASESAASTVSSYASGIEANAGAVTGAASSLSTTAFSGMDFTAATTAGTQSADAFSTGLNGGMMDLCTDTSGISLDNAALTASFGQAGTEGAGAFSTGLADGLSGLSVDTSSISLDNAALTADLGQAGADGAAVLGENLNAGLASASADTSAQMAQITAAVQDNMSQADSTVQQKMAAMVSRIQSGGSQMVQAATSAVQGIKSAFGGIDLSQSGTSMMQGLVNGISSMRGQVEAAARNVAQTAADSVNRALQIHSPSRLMIKSGQFIDEGLAGGMIKNAGKVKSAAVAAMAQPVMDTGKGMQGFSAIQSIMDMQGRKNRVHSALDGVVSSSSVINKINNSTVDNSSQSSPAFVFSPTYQINGNASREDIVQAGNISQAEFDKRMKEFMRKNGRVQFV